MHYTSEPNNDNLYWDRVCKFRRGDFHFKPYMEPVKPAEIIEFVRFGIGIGIG